MFDHDILYKVLDSHFVKHLAREGEQVTTDETTENAGAASPIPDAPDNMLEDLLDELDEVLQEFIDQYGRIDGALDMMAIGFIDGVLAQSDGSYSSYEDSYVEDMKNARFAALDKAIAEFSEGFDGNRNWDEAAMGYVRHVDGAGDKPAEDLDNATWQARAIGFIYGADLAEDYEWKIVEDPAGNILVTDEDAIQEYSTRKLVASSGGNLLDRISDVLGIDLGALESALEEAAVSEAEVEAEGSRTQE